MTTTILIAVRQVGETACTVATSMQAPRPGIRISHAEALALDLINHAKHQTQCCGVQWDQALTDSDGQNALELARDLISPEGYAYSVTPEVRNAARRVLRVRHREAV